MSAEQDAASSVSPSTASVIYPELKVNRDLLEPNFEGYKLALDQAGIVELKLPRGVDNPQLTERQYSFDHLKAYGVQNHLSLDPWDFDSAYYLDSDWNVMRVTTVVDSSPDPPRSVLQLPNAADRKLLAGRCQPTLLFASDTAACAADGCGRLFVIDTGDRAGLGEDGKQQQQTVRTDWQILATFEVEPGLLIYAKQQQQQQQNKKTLHCLLMRVREANTTDTDAFRCVLDWLSFDAFGDSSDYQQVRSRSLESSCVPNYASFDADCRHLLLACDRPFEFLSRDNGNPDNQTKKATSVPGHSQRNRTAKASVSMTSESVPSPYTWSQSADDGSIVAYVPLPPGVSKADVDVVITGTHLRVAVHGRPILDGPLFEALDKDACTWTFDSNSDSRLLELHLLGKRDPATPWPCLVTNDSRGSELPDPAAAAAAAALVAGSGDLYNAQELEDCDFPDAGGSGDDGLTRGALVWIDGEEQRVVAHTALDSTQWLFATRVTPGEPPYLCLRRDVDGILWRPDSAGLSEPSAGGGSGTQIWQHVATFHAFGFVRASKTDAKFVACAPSFGYAAVCDCFRHVYVYHSPRPADTQLRNRQTGRVIAERSSQQVVSLATQDALIGFACCDSRILVLTERALYLVRINRH